VKTNILVEIEGAVQSNGKAENDSSSEPASGTTEEMSAAGGNE